MAESSVRPEMVCLEVPHVVCPDCGFGMGVTAVFYELPFPGEEAARKRQVWNMKSRCGKEFELEVLP